MKYDCVIIGSGVAGLTSALYLARAKKTVMIIENSVLGGTTATLDIIENYPGFQSISGIDLIQNMLTQISSLGVNIDFLQIQSIDFDKKLISCDNSVIEYKTLIIASGTSYNRMNLPNEDKFKFKGLSYCAVCDGSLYKNKRIVVVTHGHLGDSALDYLSNISNDIVVVNYSDEVRDDKFITYNNATPINILGKQFVEGLEINQNNKQIKIDCDAIFVSLGKRTDLSLYKNRIECEGMYILSDENMHTNIKGVFVAGDIRKKSLRQIITACYDGAIAGTEAIKYIQYSNSN